MDQSLINFLGEGPYPGPLETLGEIVEFAYSDDVIVIVNKEEITLPALQHAHQSYEFFIPLYPSIPAQIESKKTVVPRNKLLPLNSEQFHGASSHVSGCQMWAVQINRSFLHEISRLVFGRPEVSFCNEAVKLSPDLLYLIGLFREEFANRQTGYQFVLQSLSSHIAVKILRQVKSNMPVGAKERKYTEKENINRAIDFIMDNYNTEFSLDDLAKVANLSSYHFIKVFKNHTGKTPHDYLTDIKIDHARQMLKRPQRDLTLSHICYLSGFTNLSHFSTAFKRKTGVPPSVYRKNFEI